MAKLHFHHSKPRKQPLLANMFKNIFTNKNSMILKIIFTDIYFNILIFEPDTKSVEHKHTLSAQHRLILTNTERFVTALVVGPQSYRHLFANL